MKKKTLSMLLAGAMTVGMIGSAAATTTPAIQNSQTVTAAGTTGTSNGADVDLVGQVNDATVLLSVIMPTRIDFVVSTKEVTVANGEPKMAASKADTTALVDGTYHEFVRLISGTGVITNNSNVAVKVELTHLQDQDNLTNLMDLSMSSMSLSGGRALSNYVFKANGQYDPDNGGNSIPLADNIPTNGGTANLEVVGAAGTATVGGSTVAVNLPTKSYTLVTTLRVSEATINGAGN